MYLPRIKLQAPDDFLFPHAPYDIQIQLMNALYRTLEEKRIGIFESPTGTGKSLTLTCGALRWLEDYETAVRKDLEEHIQELRTRIVELQAASREQTDWISAQYEVKEQQRNLAELEKIADLLEQYEQSLKEISERNERKLKDRHNQSRKMPLKDDILDSYEDDCAEGVLKDEDSGDDENEETTSKDSYKGVQIFFASRTHTQLAQVMREVKKTAYGKRIRCVALASRKQLCIHPQVRALQSTALINERCLDMASAKSVSSNINSKKTRIDAPLKPSKCPFKDMSKVQALSDEAIEEIRDIEDLVKSAQRDKACPYYAVRQSVGMAQLVMVPYQMLLHKRTREQTGIDLRGAVVIIDEAHNLLDTISQLYSAEITQQQLFLAKQQILNYKMRYAGQFSSSNLLNINQLLYVVKRLIILLEPVKEKPKPPRVLRTYELTADGEFFNIDLFKLLDFCENRRFAQKLQGFAKRQSNEPNPSENKPPAGAASASLSLLRSLEQKHGEHRAKSKKSIQPQPAEKPLNKNSKLESQPASPIRPLMAFLAALTEEAEDGRVIEHVDSAGDSSKSYFKYILLNPGSRFEDVIRDARAIIVAGGTMKPTNELTEQLFRHCPMRVDEHIYDHIVDKNAVMAFAITKGPSQRPIRYDYKNRYTENMMEELLLFLALINGLVPGGVIVFLPSYDYMEKFYAYKSQKSSIDFLRGKVCYQESRNANVECMLKMFKDSVDTCPSGAVLFSVVGGKLSEGLNFADDLGRAVVVVGMPYPNRTSIELQQRMKHLDAVIGADAGNAYYENLCMKVVNQCVGRSVRHNKDYATVFLFDERYAARHIQEKLPQWIRRSLTNMDDVSIIKEVLPRFFITQKACER